MTVRRFTIDELPSVLDIKASFVPHIQEYESADRLTRNVYDWGSTRLEVTLKVDADSDKFPAFMAWLSSRGRLDRFSLPLGRVTGFFGCDPIFSVSSTISRSPLFEIEKGKRKIEIGIPFNLQPDSIVGCLGQFSSQGSTPEGKVYLVTNAAVNANGRMDVFLDPPSYTAGVPEFTNPGFVFGTPIEPVFRLAEDIEIRSDPENPGDSLATLHLVEDVVVDRPVVLTLSTTTPRVGSSISADIYDPDGPLTGVTYQWQRQVDAAGDWGDVSGATGAQFDIDLDAYAADLLRVVVSYTDPAGAAQSVTSGITGTVEAQPAPAEMNPPAVPTGLVLTGASYFGGFYSLPGDWNDVADATGYQAEYESTTYGVEALVESTASNSTGFLTILGYTGTGHGFRFRVRATNEHGNSDWSGWVSLTGDIENNDEDWTGFHPGGSA